MGNQRGNYRLMKHSLVSATRLMSKSKKTFYCSFVRLHRENPISHELAASVFHPAMHVGTCHPPIARESCTVCSPVCSLYVVQQRELLRWNYLITAALWSAAPHTDVSQSTTEREKARRGRGEESLKSSMIVTEKV